MTSEPGGELAAAKAALRRRLLAGACGAEPAAAGRGRPRALRDAVLALPQAQMAGTVAAYYSIGSEPDTHGLVYALWKRGSYVLLPVLRAGRRPGLGLLRGPGLAAAGTARAARAGRAAPRRGRGRQGRPGASCPRWRSTGPGSGSAGAAAATTGRWPGSARRVPTIALLYDGELLDEVPAGRTTSGSGWPPGPRPASSACR